MAKTAILVPYPDMQEMALPLVERYPDITPMCVEYTRTDRIRVRVCELAEQGCELIVARGVQARIARQSVKIPVVEIRITTQELGMLIHSLREELGEPRPRLGLIGFANIFGDTAHFNELFRVDLRSYFVSDSEELAGAVERAVRDGCRAVIGGDIVCETAKETGLPFRFLSAGEESIVTALETASRVCYAIDLEKRDSAEKDAMLNNTFSGMIQVDHNGIVRRINRPGYDLIGRPPAEIVGRELSAVLPNMDVSVLKSTLQDGRETPAFVMEINRKAVIVNAVPIGVDGWTRGALFTFQEGERVTEMDSKLRLELYRQGYIARHTFDRVIARNPEMREALALAKRIAKYSTPILLAGEAGTGKGILAQCIHNESTRRGGAFVPLDCSAWQAETLDTMLFGNYTTRRDSSSCMAEQSRGGTLYLSHVDALPMETQYKVLNLVMGLFLHNGPNQPENTDVRVIASTDANLAAKMEKGEFRRDLYYALNVLSIGLPPMRRRKEDIAAWFDLYLSEWQERYNRHVRLTQGAYRFINDYAWPGNLDQINNLCERVVLLTEKRSVDEVFLKKQLQLVTPNLLPGTETVVLYKDPKAVELSELLRKHGGSREKAAAELGVSKTTLWRYMKKYGVSGDRSD